MINIHLGFSNFITKVDRVSKTDFTNIMMAHMNCESNGGLGGVEDTLALYPIREKSISLILMTIC